jgi:hypothetical protein
MIVQMEQNASLLSKRLFSEQLSNAEEDDMHKFIALKKAQYHLHQLSELEAIGLSILLGPVQT